MALNSLEQIIYKDIDVAFAKHPETKALPALKNERAIIRSIKNLVLTNRNERLFQPDIFSDVTASLFENMGTIEISILEDNIKRVLKNYEPRAIVNDVKIIEQLDRNAFNVKILFTPKTDSRQIEISIFLERVR